MSIRGQYWVRVFAVGGGAVLLNTIADHQLGIQIGSGRDWLLYFAILGIGFYFFVIRWAKSVGYWRE